MTNESKESEFQFKNLKRQYYAAFSASLIFFAHGSITGWFAPATPLLMSEDTPLASGPITMEQLSWIGSVPSIGAVISILSFGYVKSLMGCKNAMAFLAIPAILFWLIIIFANSFYHILIARFVLGWLGGGINATAVLYIAEIANDNIRGKLGTAVQLFRNIGTLIAYIIGATVAYVFIPYIYIFVPIVFLVTFTLLPNTPQYFLQKGYNEKAEKSLKYYKGCRIDDTEHDKQAFEKEFERLQAIASERKGNEKVRPKDLCERKALRGIFIGIMLPFYTVFTGSFTIMTYSVQICALSGMQLNPYVASIILSCVQISATFCTTQLVDILGRKKLMIISLFGASVGLSALSTYLYLDQHNYDLLHFNWVPVTSLAFIIFMSSSGIGPLASVCTVENLPSKVRPVGLTIYCLSTSSFSFLSMKFFPVLIGIIEMHGCMLIFGIASLTGIFFVYFVLEETNGKCLDTTDWNSHTVSHDANVKFDTPNSSDVIPFQKQS